MQKKALIIIGSTVGILVVGFLVAAVWFLYPGLDGIADAGGGYDLYGSADLAYVLWITGTLSDRTTAAGRAEWGAVIDAPGGISLPPEWGQWTVDAFTARLDERTGMWKNGVLTQSCAFPPPLTLAAPPPSGGAR